jgi:putative ubiquitin-RnfH superfamily antitoxin RatB of RatAB toxin-antitoxin module
MLEKSIQIVVVYSTQARLVFEYIVDLPAFSQVSDAIRVCKSLSSFPNRVTFENGVWTLGVWGRPVTEDYVLQEGDRLELYRSLQVDPKVARRERFQKQGTRAAGLFATRRKGAKPGY